MRTILLTLIAAGFPAVAALADDPGKMAAGNWSVSFAGGFSDVGQSDHGTVSLTLPVGSTHFVLRLVQSAWTSSQSLRDRVSVQFVGGGNYELVATRSGNAVTAAIPDPDMVGWTHDFTAQSAMRIDFPTMSEPTWVVPLNGTTPTVSAMAKAIELAGITGAPAPWTPKGNGASTSLAPQIAATTAFAPPAMRSVSHSDCVAAGQPMWVGGMMSPDAAVERERACEQGYLDRAAAARREDQVRQQQAALEVQAQAQREAAAAELVREQIAAETSPDNHCKEPKFAGDMIDQTNDLMTRLWLGEKVVDIEHLTTISWSPDTLEFRCRGVFITNGGHRKTGVFGIRPNVAGRMLYSWNSDQ